MVRFVTKHIAGLDGTGREQLVKVVKAVSAEAGLRHQQAEDAREASEIEEGRKLIGTDSMRCSECHQFRKVDEDATAPSLTGYGSREWLIGIIANPKHERFYGPRSERMPAFGSDKILSEQAIGLLADWLRGEWYEVERR